MHGDDLIELLFGHLAHRCVAGDAGVVDHDVQPAESVDGGGDQGVDVGRGSHIAADRHGDVIAAELRRRGLGCLEIHVTEHYPCPFGNEPLRYGETQTLGTAGNNCGLTLQQRHLITVFLLDP